MKPILLFLLAGTMLAISCKEKKQDSENEMKQSVNTDPVKDSAEIRAVVTAFYDWYNTNYTKLMKYDLYDGINKKDAPPYRINWDEVEKYQQFIRDSIPQLGEAFLQDQKRFFASADSAFKKDVEDEIPYGFDYDWYTNSQEDPQYTLEMVNRSEQWVMKIDGDKAEVGILTQEEGSTGLIFQMKKENGKWTIAKIGEI